MTENHPGLRSALFVPAVNSRAMEKTLQLSMDAVILDLEDSVSAQEKATAHNNLSAFMSANPILPFFQAIRINALDPTSGYNELYFAVSLKPDAIVLPKVENAQTLHDAIAAIKSKTDHIPDFWAMIETPVGIMNVADIAACHGLKALIVGPNDITQATGINAGENRRFLIPWLMQIMLAAKAFKITVFDGVYNDFRDSEGFRAECAAGAAMGFDGKTLIHPTQIDIANAAFMPSAEAIAKAQTIVAAFNDPANHNKGVIAVNGEMVERLHLKQAKMLLARVNR